MKYVKLLIVTMALSVVLGCATFKQNEVLEKVGVQYAVMKVVESTGNTADYSARAQKIVDIASDAKSFWDNDGTQLNALQDLVNAKLSKLTLSPADQFLASSLVQTVVAELQSRVGAGSIPPDQVYQVSTVLGWVVDAAKAYVK